MWSIEDQSFDDPASGFRFEFTTSESVLQDVRGECVLKLWNMAKDRCLTVVFQKDGFRLASDVELGVPATVAERAMAAETGILAGLVSGRETD